MTVAAASDLLLDLGSGPVVAEGWVSIDGSWSAWLARHPVLLAGARLAGLAPSGPNAVVWPDTIVCLDLRRGLPYPAGSARGIFAAHLFEHLTREEGARLLVECHRVLRPGGILRIIVPDLQTLVRWYRETTGEGAPDRENASHRFLVALNLAPARGWPAGVRSAVARLVSHAGHRVLYDRLSLAAAIEGAGFAGIRACSPLESRIPTIERVEHAGHHEGALCLEAERPTS